MTTTATHSNTPARRAWIVLVSTLILMLAMVAAAALVASGGAEPAIVAPGPLGLNDVAL